VPPDEAAAIDLEVRNAGRITWTTQGNNPFVLGYRWLTDDGSGVLDLPPTEIALPRDVEPGATIRLRAIVPVPDLPAGTYRLDWGMLQRDVVQFYERGWADAETVVSVRSGTAVMPDIRLRDDSEAPWVVGRLDLWSSALKLFATHPLLGVGPDNFRHLYGAELGLEGWDERVQANNLYLEVLADLGILGLAVFGWLVARPLATTLRTLISAPRYSDEVNYIRLGVMLALTIFLVHGVLDTFLAFTPTALLFWMLLGIAEAQKPQVSGR